MIADAVVLVVEDRPLVYKEYKYCIFWDDLPG